MRKIDKALEMIGEWDYDRRHQFELDAMDHVMTLKELVIDRFCPIYFGMECDCRFLECIDCWLLEDEEN